MNMKTNKNYLYHKLAAVEERANICLRLHGYDFRPIERRYRVRKRDMGLVYCVMKDGQERELRIPITRGWNYTLHSGIRLLRLRFQSEIIETAYRMLCAKKDRYQIKQENSLCSESAIAPRLKP